MSSSNASKGAKSNFSMPGAESARARARELLARCIARTEGEFASAMRAHDARAMGIAHRPDGPRAIASMRSLGIRDENWDEADEEDTLSPRASSSTPSTPMSPTTARRAHRAALLDVDPGLKSVAAWLLSNPLPSVKKDTNAICTQLYVDARTASLVDATNRDGLAQLCAESAEDTFVNRGKSDGAKFGLGDGEVWVEKTRRWSEAIANCVNRWEAEPALATAVLGAEGGAEGGAECRRGGVGARREARARLARHPHLPTFIECGRRGSKLTKNLTRSPAVTNDVAATCGRWRRSSAGTERRRALRAVTIHVPTIHIYLGPSGYSRAWTPVGL